MTRTRLIPRLLGLGALLLLLVALGAPLPARAMFLAGPDAGYLTGITIPVDGGAAHLG